MTLELIISNMLLYVLYVPGLLLFSLMIDLTWVSRPLRRHPSLKRVPFLVSAIIISSRGLGRLSLASERSLQYPFHCAFAL